MGGWIYGRVATGKYILMLKYLKDPLLDDEGFEAN